MNRYVLALDLGASSGRAMLAAYDGEKIRLREVHRPCCQRRQTVLERPSADA